MKMLLLSIVLSFISLSASAGLLLEPHLGYESSTVVANTVATPWVNDGYKTTGMSYGARIGYKLPVLFWLAADIDMSSGSVTWADSTANTASFTFTRSDTYLVAGLDLPILLRAWVGYGFASSDELKYPATGISAKATGTATKVGVAFTGLPFINLTAEVIMRTMKDFEQTGSVKSSIDSNFATYKDAGIRLGISLPFVL